MFGLFLFWIFSFKDVQPGLFFIRIFRVLNTVQSFIFKVHLVVSLSAATLIVYHSFKLLSTTFLNFFLNLFRFALLFSAACYILPDVHVLVNSFFIFLFNPRCFSRVSYTISFNRWFVNRFFQFFVLFFNKRGSRMKSIHPAPSSAASPTKNHLICEETAS